MTSRRAVCLFVCGIALALSRQEALTGFKVGYAATPPPPPTPPPTPPSALRLHCPTHRPHPHSNVCPNPLRSALPTHSTSSPPSLTAPTAHRLHSSAIVPTWPPLVRGFQIFNNYLVCAQTPSALTAPTTLSASSTPTACSAPPSHSTSSPPSPSLPPPPRARNDAGRRGSR